MASVNDRPDGPRKVRYTVVGLGHIAQAAVLPAFAHAGENSELVGVVSGDADKRHEAMRRYKLPHSWSYEQYDEALASGLFDAVYIAMPNDLHREYTVRAARAGIHVLCEKPMEVSTEFCEEMIRTAEEHDVRLMIAYRLHFERANLEAMEIVRSKRLGEPRIFSSVFSQQVRGGNSRLRPELGGGTLFDIGIYCINAARSVFQAEPIEVFAFSARGEDERFDRVEEMVSALLRFPNERLATFTCSFGASHAGSYRVIGTRGELRVDPAYNYTGPLQYETTVDGHKKKKDFGPRDQFAPELVYFSECVQSGQEPEPSGLEGLADVRVIEALYRSAKTGRPERLGGLERPRRPHLGMADERPPVVAEPPLIGVEPPSA